MGHTVLKENIEVVQFDFSTWKNIDFRQLLMECVIFREEFQKQIKTYKTISKNKNKTIEVFLKHFRRHRNRDYNRL